MEKLSAVAASAGGQARNMQQPAYVQPAPLKPIYKNRIERVSVGRGHTVAERKQPTPKPWLYPLLKHCAKTLLPYVTSAWTSAPALAKIALDVTTSAVQWGLTEIVARDLHKTAPVLEFGGQLAALGQDYVKEKYPNAPTFLNNLIGIGTKTLQAEAAAKASEALYSNDNLQYQLQDQIHIGFTGKSIREQANAEYAQARGLSAVPKWFSSTWASGKDFLAYSPEVQSTTRQGAEALKFGGGIVRNGLSVAREGLSLVKDVRSLLV